MILTPLTTVPSCQGQAQLTWEAATNVCRIKIWSMINNTVNDSTYK